jgi:hypothetical protein
MHHRQRTHYQRTPAFDVETGCGAGALYKLRTFVLLPSNGLYGHYEFRALLSTGSGALTMRVRFR